MARVAGTWQRSMMARISLRKHWTRLSAALRKVPVTYDTALPCRSGGDPLLTVAASMTVLCSLVQDHLLRRSAQSTSVRLPKPHPT